MTVVELLCGCAVPQSWGQVALFDDALEIVPLAGSPLTCHFSLQKLKFADSQLKAKEFSVPEEPRVMTYCDNIGGEGRGVTPGPAAVRGRKQVGSASSPQAFQQAQEEQRKRFGSALPLAESYIPRPYPAAELTATRAERLERPQALSELENELPSSQRLLAAARAPGAAGNPRSAGASSGEQLTGRIQAPEGLSACCSASSAPPAPGLRWLAVRLAGSRGSRVGLAGYPRHQHRKVFRGFVFSLLWEGGGCG